MENISSFINKIRPALKGKPDVVIKDCFREVVKEFCEKSWGCREVIKVSYSGDVLRIHIHCFL